MIVRFIPIATVIAALAAFGADDSFTGTWKLNLQQSKLPRPAPRSETARIEADAKSIRIHLQGVDDEGNEFSLKISADFGGRDFGVLNSSKVDTVRLDRRNNRSISFEALQSGISVMTGTGSISRDAKTLKVEFSVLRLDGPEAKYVALFARQ